MENQAIDNTATSIRIGGFAKTIKFKILSTSFLTIALFITPSAQSLDKTKLDQLFTRLNEKNKAMGSLMIAKDGSVLYSRSIGYSSINGTEKKPSTAATRYRVGSITKMFTAVMVFQLIEKGKLKLTDHLGKFFPQVPKAERITIANILAHRSGIHDVSEDQDFRARRLNGITKDELFALIIKSKPDFEPGAKYAYSNTGFQLLAMLVEKLTGKPYEEVLKDRITSKIGLEDTYVGTANINASKNESFSYKYGRDWEQQPETQISLLFGAGSLVSTPADMAKFIHSLFEGKVVSKKNLKLMMADKLGMETFTYNGKTAYGHTGGVDGFGSWLVYMPEQKLAVSYAANGKVYPVTEIIDGVFNIYFNKPYTIPAFDTIAIQTDLLDKYVGVYSSPEVPVKFTVTREGTKLFVQMPNQSVVPLEPTAEDKFKIESAPIEFRFNAEKNELIVIRSGRERILSKEK